MTSWYFVEANWQKLLYKAPGVVWGDWSWKPERNALIPQFEMPAFKGVPKNGAELSHR